MKRIEEYCDFNIPLEARFQELSDRASFPRGSSPGVNAAIAAFVIKYMATFADVSQTDIREFTDNTNNAGEITKGALKLMHAGSHRLEITSLACLYDTNATSALFKEIAFRDDSNAPVDEEIYGIDFGSGTGILTAAMACAAKRNNVKGAMVGFEQFQGLTQRSKNIADCLNPVLEKSGLVFSVQNKDVLDPVLYEVIQRQQAKLRYWVSETFNRSMPTPVIKDGKLIWHPDYVPTKRILSSVFDPYADVVDLSVQHFPNFLQKVRNGEILMFPDFVNGKFKGEIEKGCRISIGGQMQNLTIVGSEFAEFENPNPNGRFPLSELSRHQDKNAPLEDAMLAAFLGRKNAQREIKEDDEREEEPHVLSNAERQRLLKQKMNQKRKKK